MHGVPAEFAEERQRNPLWHAAPGTALETALVTKEAVQVSDVQSEPAYQIDPARRAGLLRAGARTVLCVPMLKDDELIGGITIYRQEVRPLATSRSSWSPISPPRPSSPSRTPACSTSCANRCSSRPPPPTCSRSSAARPSICRRCSIRWSSRRRGCARPTWRRSHRRRARSISMWRATATPAEYRRVHATAIRSRPSRGSVAGRTVLEGKTVHVPDVLADPELTLGDAAEELADCAPCSAFRCCAKECRLA